MDDLSEKPVEEELKWFKCKVCKMRELYNFKESKPKFLPTIAFADGCYVVKDPFTAPEKKQFFILGSDCYVCREPVCQANECSIFFQQRYCQNCAWKHKNSFPEQLWSKIKDPSSH